MNIKYSLMNVCWYDVYVECRKVSSMVFVVVVNLKVVDSFYF